MITFKKYIFRIVRWFGYDIYDKKEGFHYAPDIYGKKWHKFRDLRENQDFYRAAQEVIDAKRTLLYYDKLFILFEILKSIFARHKNPVLVEVGVYRGGASYFFGSVAESLGGHSYTLYSIDTFRGNVPEDLPAGIEGEKHTVGHFSDVDFNDVSSYLARYKNIKTVEGRIQDIASALPEKEFHFIHADVDIYAPTAFTLSYFGSRMARGGIIVVDDYPTKKCPGVERAVDEYCRAHPKVIKIMPLTGQCILIFN